MEVSVRNIVQRVAVQLYDEGNSNWSEPELAQWLREGVGALATLRPDLFTRTRTIPLEPGAKQSLPASSTRVTRVLGVREGGEDAPMRALTRFDMRSMSASDPDWQETPPSRPRQYTTTADQDVFWLYPSVPEGADYYADVESVEVPEIPMPKDWPEDDPVNIQMDTRFERALVDYVLYRSLSKDADYAANGQRAAAHQEAFQNAAYDSFYPPPREAVEQAQRQAQQHENQRR